MRILVQTTGFACFRTGTLVAFAFLSSAYAARTCAQGTAVLPAVKRVAFDWASSDQHSSAVGDRVLHKLKASKLVTIVSSSEQADETLRGNATIWAVGREASSLRSKGAERTIYKGYASIEVAGKDGQVLWSYLATPRSVGWSGIREDLADQLAQEFLKRSKAGGPAELPDGTRPAADRRSGQGVSLHGSGSTFAAPMYLKWFESFTHARPEVHIQYDALGSGEGIDQVLAGQTDFGATDMPLSGEQLNNPRRTLAQVATMLGAVVPVYNLNGVSDLNMSGEVLAGIFLGKIRRWNTPEIRAINKGTPLPDEAIQVIHRSDSSGTTFVWTDYLSKVSPEWQHDVGDGMVVKWPVGSGAAGNTGVALAVQKTNNSVGYVELIYALKYELPFASVGNRSGEYVRADLDSVTAAAKAAESSEQNGARESVINAQGKHVYPISTLTWLLVPQEAADETKKAAVREVLQWVLTSGQRQCQGLGYVPLPSKLAKRELKKVASLQ